MPKLQEKSSALKREHPVLKTWKFWTFFYFCGSFLPSWIRIRSRNLNADPDPNPATQINADPCGSGSETLIPSRDIMSQEGLIPLISTSWECADMIFFYFKGLSECFLFRKTDGIPTKWIKIFVCSVFRIIIFFSVNGNPTWLHIFPKKALEFCSSPIT
jgi:hypothetical protein